MVRYIKGDLERANARCTLAKKKYDAAESALAVARHDLRQAERERQEAFDALRELASQKGQRHDG